MATGMERAWAKLLRSLAWATQGHPLQHWELARAASALLVKEPLRAREAWVIEADALIEMGRLEEAEERAHEMQDLCEQLADEVGLGYAHYLFGHMAARRGQYDEACASLSAAMEHSRRGGDVAFELTSGARLALERALHGETEAAVTEALRFAEKYRAKRLRHYSTVTDGVFLAAAALHWQQRGEPDRDLRRHVSRFRRGRKRFVQKLRYVAPLFLAGSAACDIAGGKIRAGRRGFVTAVRFAERYSLTGELYDVYRLAGQVLPEGDPAGTHYRAEAASLRARFGG
jgi:tetratricopeptide (TPR) repeat protein